MEQPELIQPEHLASRLKWERLFEFLPPWPVRPPRRGRKPVDRDAMLRALIYQRLARKRFLQDLHTHLAENPPMRAACGFNPYQPPPSLERFSAFLGDTANQLFQTVRVHLVKELIQARVVSGRHVGFDSCPVESWVRENNLKTGLRRSRYDKTHLCRGDPTAALGVRIHYPSPGKKEVAYFWGYRNHALADLEAELPLWEITEPNSVAEVTLAIPLLKNASGALNLTFQSVSGDAEYDVERILRYIVKDSKAEAFIPRNPRNTQDTSGFQRRRDNVTCPADLTMYRKGKMTVDGVTYVQYSCPFYWGRKPDLLMCPVNHPKFTQQKGCNYLWRQTETIRALLPYGTDYFKRHYDRRTAVERVFSRLLAITLEEPSVRGLTSVKNHCTLSHISVLLVALAAHRLGHADKIRFVRTFVPNILAP